MTEMPTPNPSSLPPELAERLTELPREIKPPRDLWPGIAARLRAPRPTLAERARGWLAASPWSGFTPGQWVAQAVMATCFLALGAWLARSVAPPPATPAAAVGAGVEVVTPASSRASSWAAAGSFAMVEAEYLRAKDDLWLTVLDRREELSPGTLRVVERNLRILDAAIRELRSALEADPGNPQLEGQLLALNRRSLRLLQRLVHAPA